MNNVKQRYSYKRAAHTKEHTKNAVKALDEGDIVECSHSLKLILNMATEQMKEEDRRRRNGE